MRERFSRMALLVLVAMIPFELRFTILGLSNLQWMFVIVVIGSSTLLLKNWAKFPASAAILPAAAFVISQWAATLAAPDFFENAVKAAIRMTVGFTLMVIVAGSIDKQSMMRTWAAAAVVAAGYALAAYAGFGAPAWFRTEEYYAGTVQRLSGSFDYPNTAATFFSMSLPIVWMAHNNIIWRYVGAGLLWTALLLTQSSGGLVAIAVVAGGAALFRRFGSGDVTLPLKTLMVSAGICLFIYLFTMSWSAAFGARYELQNNRMRLKPGELNQAEITIWNTGQASWPHEGRRRIGLAYRWFDVDRNVFLTNDPIQTPLAESVPEEGRISINAPFRTPPSPGKFLLVWELFHGELDWFSRMGIIPALAEVDVVSDAEPWIGNADLSKWYKAGGNDGRALNASVTRRDLWTAAGRMFLEHPVLGVGPDNYRLRYGSYLDHTKWDRNIRANNLYWEVLTGSGIVGLVFFLVMMIRREWRLTPVSLALAAFMVHGLVDVFLMTTPIYFGFWVLMGLGAEGGRA